ncbi:MAG: choice-of-anchor J domain-containing protein [Prevotella sp.]|nr:choice-of-anchor J domain-containing protein [Prevotella sp.]
MSKRITSFLLGALAVVLLGVPAQAQQIQKAQPNKAKGLAAMYVKKMVGTQQAIVDLLSGDAEKKAAAAAQLLKDQRDEKETASTHVKGLTWKLYGQATSMTVNDLGRTPINYQAKDMNVRLLGETIDENGVITAPAEGEEKFYTRSGVGYYVSNNQIYVGDQSGTTTMVETADGEVFIKDFISYVSVNTWVKGTIEGNTITIPLNQMVYWSSYGYGLRLSLVSYDAEAGFAEVAADNITLTVDADGNITLEGTGDPLEGNNFVGLFWTDDDTFSGYGDYETVFTLIEDYEAPELITPPAGLETTQLSMSGLAYSSAGSSNISGKCNVGFDGNDVYVQGLFEDFPAAWIKGSLEGNIVTFPAFQYLGDYSSYNIWMVGATYDEVEEGYFIDDFQMEYDAELNKFTAINDVIANAATDRIYYLSWYGEVTLKVPSEVVETGDPIDELPYANAFNNADEAGEFGILDANEDGKTWTYTGDDQGGYFGNPYNSSADADDWLISPAIKLEVGKIYHFAIDAWCRMASYPERIEVKMGTTAKASALVLPVIESTDVTWTAAQTLENATLIVEETGYYHFGIHAISDADEYYLYVDNFLIEEGADPAAPAAITDLTVVPYDGEVAGATITFTAPTLDVSGAALTENISVKLLRDGQVINVFEDVVPGSVVVYEDNDPALQAGYHTYQAIPVNALGDGAKSEEVTVFINAILQVPYTADFSTAAAFELFNVIDANEDGTTWQWSASNGAYYGYSSSNSADDYLITMPIALKAGKFYNFIMNVGSSSSWPERFEVLVGKEGTVEGLTQTIIPATDYQSSDFVDFEQEFSVAEDGNYFVAIHAISDADMFNLKVKYITIEAGMEPTAPAAPRLAVQPDPFGAHKAVVTVTAPRLANDGSVLNNIGKLVIYRDGAPIKEYENVLPEATKVYVDYNVEGSHKYQAIPYDADGGRGAKSELVNAYIGLDAPAAPSNLTAYETVDGVVLNWDAVTVGQNGGIVNPDEVVYKVWTAHEELYWGMFLIVVLDDVVATTTETTATIALDNTGDQQIEYLCVTAENELNKDLTAEERSFAYAEVFAGAPYQMPIEENFGEEFDYGWIMNFENVDGTYSSESADDDGNSVVISGYGGDAFAEFTSGKIAMREGNPTLIVHVKGEGSNKNRFKVKVITPDGKEKLVKTVALTEDFQPVKVSLADYTEEPFIKVVLRCDFKDAGNIWFDALKISDMLEYNLATTIEAPKSVMAGQSAEVGISVRNIGEKAAKNFTVKLFANEEEILNEEITEPLISYETMTLLQDIETSIFDEPGDIKLRAEVEYEYDLDEDDNTAEAVIALKQSTAAAPENLQGEKTETGVKLSWTAPANSTEEVLEDFAELEADNISDFGEWTAINNNGEAKGSLFTDLTLASDGQVAAFLVVRPSDMGIANTALAGPNGTLDETYLLSGYNYDGNGGYPDNDDWLISPALPGVAQTITFYVSALSIQYGPTDYEVYASSTGNAIADFTKVGGETLTQTGWKQVSYDLPEGTTYFAIRNNTNGDAALAFCVADIQYTRGGGSVANYNVWVDGEVAESTTETSIELEGATTENVFAVSAVYANGAESRPVVFVFSNNGMPTAIKSLINGNKPADIYTLDGKLVRSQATSLEGLHGTFVIEGYKVVVK